MTELTLWQSLQRSQSLSSVSLLNSNVNVSLLSLGLLGGFVVVVASGISTRIELIFASVREGVVRGEVLNVHKKLCDFLSL